MHPQFVPYTHEWAKACEEIQSDKCVGRSGQERFRTLILKAILSKNAHDLSEFYWTALDIIERRRASMKPRSTFAKDHLHQIYPDPVPWVGEVFDPRIETLLESPDIDNKDRLMIRLPRRSIQDSGRCAPPAEISQAGTTRTFQQGADGGNCKG
jgi:hypothetical protein